MHDVVNTKPAHAVSVHAYSPPLTAMSYYAVDPTGDLRRTRMHLLLKCPELEPVLPAIRRVAGTFPNDNNLSVILDVDPINMM